MDRRTFDVQSLLTEIAPDAEATTDAYAPPRTRASLVSEARGDGGTSDSGRPTPGPEVALEAVRPPRPDEAPAEDAINPAHYRSHPSGIECIEVTRHMNFNVGNSIKYLWRYMDKGDPIENLKKAQWYIDDEIRRLQGLR